MKKTPTIEIQVLDAESKYYRVTHAGDPIPLVPDPKLGFRHPNTEYYIADSTSSSSSPIVKCDPSNANACSESQTSLISAAFQAIADSLLGLFLKNPGQVVQGFGNLRVIVTGWITVR
jgi:hypothetical protein